MGPPQGRAEGEENLPDLLAALLLMHPRIPLTFWAPRALLTFTRAALHLSPPRRILVSCCYFADEVLSGGRGEQLFWPVLGFFSPLADARVITKTGSLAVEGSGSCQLPVHLSARALEPSRVGRPQKKSDNNNNNNSNNNNKNLFSCQANAAVHPRAASWSGTSRNAEASSLLRRRGRWRGIRVSERERLAF